MTATPDGMPAAVMEQAKALLDTSREATKTSVLLLGIQTSPESMEHAAVFDAFRGLLLQIASEGADVPKTVVQILAWMGSFYSRETRQAAMFEMLNQAEAWLERMETPDSQERIASNIGVEGRS